MPDPFYVDPTGIMVYCADAREVLHTLADGSIDFIFTDPPYGHNNNDGDLIHNREEALGLRKNTSEDSRPIANDGAEATAELVSWAFPEFYRLLSPGCCCCCCCGGGGPDPQFARWSLQLDEAFHGGFKQMVVWDKGPIGMGWHYRRSYETVLVAEKPGAACRWFDTTNQIENILRHIRKVIPSAAHHPTPKPIELVEYFLKLHTRPGDLVLDPFGGGGTTARACKNIGRRCISVDLEPQWVSMTVDRLRRDEGGLFDEPPPAVPIADLFAEVA